MLVKKELMPIQLKITILSFGVVLFSILMGGLIIISKLENIKEDELRKRTMITARTVAQLPEIHRNIKLPYGWEKINPVVERIRIINNADYIVVLNKDRIRYSHPVRSLIGSVSQGEDEGAAFAEHSYTSLAKGEVGIAVRAFVPILNEHRDQIGVVIVGNILPSFFDLLKDILDEISLIFFFTLLFGIVGSYFLARHIKDQMFHLEPHEIVQMLVERTATFNAMHEGVIAIAKNLSVTIFNEKAKQMLGIKGDVIGKKITDVLPDTRLPEVIKKEKAVYNQEIQIRQTNIMSNRVPIRVNDQIVGAVAIFQDITKVKKMAEELTGVKAFVEALRVQNHEHMNKLHTIAGLIQLGNQEKALKYVFQVSEEHEALTRFLSKNIRNESIAGLLISKVSRGKELGVHVEIDKQSRLDNFPKLLDHHDFVVIIGNLIENAFTALASTTVTDKHVFISIDQNDEMCEILIEDNGIGIPEHIQEFIFDKGFTTKRSMNHGIGLYLIKQIVEKASGNIKVISKEGEGTSIIVTIPM